MRGEQKTVEAGCPSEGTVEPESSKGALSASHTETNEADNAEGLLEAILSRDNLNAAYVKVKQNKGAAGVDGMSVEDMLPYLKEHREELLERIRKGKYRPKPVRRVEIPKPDGGVRLLGIPTVIDRMLQQAVAQVLEPIFEETFSDYSYGFRPGRSAHDAIGQAEEYYKQGYTQVVDIDLQKYFDTVNHDILLGLIQKHVKDGRVVGLIHRFLKSGVMMGQLYSATNEGTPQGGNLSPLLSNIYLTPFDRELEARGHKFVRYADDCNIYVKSERAAGRVMESCTEYLEKKLKLTVNREKSEAGSPLKRKFLGFSMYHGTKKIGIRIHEKSLKRFKDRIRQLTSRKQAKPMWLILRNLRQYTRGWLGYYALADMKSKMADINQWTRRRIRQIYWKQWEKPSARFKNLKRLGVDERKAREWSFSKKGYWRVAKSWILTTSLTNKFLASQGYDDILLRYEALHSRY